MFSTGSHKSRKSSLAPCTPQTPKSPDPRHIVNHVVPTVVEGVRYTIPAIAEQLPLLPVPIRQQLQLDLNTYISSYETLFPPVELQVVGALLRIRNMATLHKRMHGDMPDHVKPLYDKANQYAHYGNCLIDAQLYIQPDYLGLPYLGSWAEPLFKPMYGTDLQDVKKHRQNMLFLQLCDWHGTMAVDKMINPNERIEMLDRIEPLQQLFLDDPDTSFRADVQTEATAIDEACKTLMLEAKRRCDASHYCSQCDHCRKAEKQHQDTRPPALREQLSGVSLHTRQIREAQNNAQTEQEKAEGHDQAEGNV